MGGAQTQTGWWKAFSDAFRPVIIVAAIVLVVIVAVFAFAVLIYGGPGKPLVILVGDKSPLGPHQTIGVILALIGYFVVPIYLGLIAAALLGTYFLHSHRTTQDVVHELRSEIEQMRQTLGATDTDK